jgi:hypothetical protein
MIPLGVSAGVYLLYLAFSGNSSLEHQEKMGRGKDDLPLPAQGTQNTARSSKRSRPLISDRLAPDLQIIEGKVDGAVITGPVKVSGTMPPSKIASKNGIGMTFVIEATGNADTERALLIEAASARATEDGVRFAGPLRLQYQGDEGQWYEIRGDSKDAYCIVGKDGRKKVFADPSGLVKFGSLGPLSP